MLELNFPSFCWIPEDFLIWISVAFEMKPSHSDRSPDLALSTLERGGSSQLQVTSNTAKEQEPQQGGSSG